MKLNINWWRAPQVWEESTMKWQLDQGSATPVAAALSLWGQGLVSLPLAAAWTALSEVWANGPISKILYSAVNIENFGCDILSSFPFLVYSCL